MAEDTVQLSSYFGDIMISYGFYRTNEGDFSTEPHLSEIAEILAGSAEIFQGKILMTCETWYEWMVGKLLFTNPAIKIYDLSNVAEEAIAKFGGLSSMTTLDSVILAAMELDIPQAIII